MIVLRALLDSAAPIDSKHSALNFQIPPRFRLHILFIVPVKFPRLDHLKVDIVTLLALVRCTSNLSDVAALQSTTLPETI